jgi:hypothetical protein
MCRLDGSFGEEGLDLSEYHKALIALQVCSYSNSAKRHCDWIRKNGIRSDGDFGPRRKNYEDYGYTYPNSWLVMGAHQFGHFDISLKGMEFLMDFWDSKSGGFYSRITKRDADTEQDLIYVSFCGLAALYTGNIDVATSVGCWMRTIMNQQPHFPERLYTIYSRASGLEVSPEPGKELRYVVVQNAKRYQRFFQPGAGAAFLANLFWATGEKEWLDLAKEYMRFAEGASEYLLSSLGAGKVAWAASLLYTITRENRYKELAIRIGDNLIKAQSRKGFWRAPGSKSPSVAVTAEMITWLDAIHQTIGRD